MQGINKYASIQQVIGYEFNDIALLERALTHRSAAKKHNERLEFLGDAILGMVIAEALYREFPSVPEGKLTRMRASLVKGETLAEIAREANMGDLLKLGPGELKSGGHRRSSILADAVEAVLGAVYLESGFEQARDIILGLWRSRMAALDPNSHPKDAKTRLQEYLQSRKLPLPTYDVLDVSGKDHAQTFTVRCTVSGLAQPVEGRGNSRRKAEQAAAKRAMEQINEQ